MMLGSMITKVRKDKNITKVYVARNTGINIGHLSHIEKNERTPSHKALKKICKALEIPYQPLMYTYDKEITDDHKRYKWSNHICCTKIPAFENFEGLVDCPTSIPTASIALKVPDDAMEPILPKGSCAFLEFNTPLDTKDIGLFIYNGEFFIRHFIIRKDKLVLRAENKNYPEIDFDEDADFTIIGKIYPMPKS